MQRLFYLFILFIPLLHTPANATDTSVGSAVKVQGYAGMIRRNLVFPLGTNDKVFWQDILETRGKARLNVLFIDNTRLMMGNDSRLTIDELVFQPNQKGRALFSLSQGVFRMVTGSLNKINNSDFTLRTPLATIGVRGTDFWGHQTDKKLTMALLDDGKLEISTPNGQVTLSEPLSAVVIEAGKEIGKPFQLTPEQVEQAKRTVE